MASRAVRGSSLGRIGSSVARAGYVPKSSSRKLRHVEDGRCFQVEPLPADHSCGFHGLGIAREEASDLLLQHQDDAEVQEFVAADLAASLQTGERKSFPRELREDQELWGALTAYYAAQQGFDQSRREARELLTDDYGVEAVDSAVEKAGGDVAEALHLMYSKLKKELKSGTATTVQMRRLARCKAQAEMVRTALLESREAEQALHKRCRSRFEAYVRWVGSDRSFWLSFVRGCGNERTGGLLDALAKVRKLNVYIWADKLGASEKPQLGEEPLLELVHEALFGAKTLHLWYQGDRGHFDRLLPYSVKSTAR
jgi:hypothetical protein